MRFDFDFETKGLYKTKAKWSNPQKIHAKAWQEVYTDSYMASNGSCFMVTWTDFENQLLKVGLTQNRGTMALRKLTTISLFLFYHVWGSAWIDIHWNGIWLRNLSHMTSHYTWGSVTTPNDFGGVSGWPVDTFFWALTMSWSRLSARVWSGP